MVITFGGWIRVLDVLEVIVRDEGMEFKIIFFRF